MSELIRKTEISPITVVFFSCSGREHLLIKAIEAFGKNSNFEFKESILAFDGPIDPTIDLRQLGIDRLINNCQRRGYVNSIRNALGLISTQYFFWQEDDCIFLRDIEMQRLKNEMDNNPSWVQVGWGIGTKFPDHEEIYPLGRDNMFGTAYGFSARPSLCRTSDIRDAFYDMEDNSDIPKNQGFETYLRDWLSKELKSSVSINPGDRPAYSHEALIESTSRKYHCVSSDPDNINAYMANTRQLPPLRSRFKMILRLALCFAMLCLQQLVDGERYHLAWRVVHTEKTTRDK